MFQKLSKFTQNAKVKKVMGITMAIMCLASCFIVGCSATDVTEPTPVSAATTVFQTLHESLNFTTILSVIGVALGAGVGIFLGWWAIRKVLRVVMSAFKKGKISV